MNILSGKLTNYGKKGETPEHVTGLESYEHNSHTYNVGPQDGQKLVYTVTTI